jgi:hypothetical protein
VDTDALNFAVHSALSKALTKNTSDDHSRFQRTISDLQDRLSAAEVSHTHSLCNFCAFFSQKM